MMMNSNMLRTLALAGCAISCYAVSDGKPYVLNAGLQPNKGSPWASFFVNRCTCVVWTLQKLKSQMVTRNFVTYNLEVHPDFRNAYEGLPEYKKAVDDGFDVALPDETLTTIERRGIKDSDLAMVSNTKAYFLAKTLLKAKINAAAAQKAKEERLEMQRKASETRRKAMARKKAEEEERQRLAEKRAQENERRLREENARKAEEENARKAEEETEEEYMLRILKEAQSGLSYQDPIGRHEAKLKAEAERDEAKRQAEEKARLKEQAQRDARKAEADRLAQLADAGRKAPQRKKKRATGTGKAKAGKTKAKRKMSKDEVDRDVFKICTRTLKRVTFKHWQSINQFLSQLQKKSNSIAEYKNNEMVKSIIAFIKEYGNKIRRMKIKEQREITTKIKAMADAKKGKFISTIQRDQFKSAFGTVFLKAKSKANGLKSEEERLELLDRLKERHNRGQFLAWLDRRYPHRHAYPDLDHGVKYPVENYPVVGGSEKITTEMRQYFNEVLPQESQLVLCSCVKYCRCT